jgi:hypothetical protein
MRFFKNIILWLTTKRDFSKETFLQYRIPSRKHYSRGEGLLPNKSKKSYIDFSVKFNKNADVYVEENPQQINKAIGLKEGLVPNKNSVILGFSTYNNNFELWLFVNYEDKSFDHIKIGKFKTEEWINNIRIGIDKDFYYIVHDGKRFELPRNSNQEVPSILGLIQPYFGGKAKNIKNNDIEILFRM